LFHEGGLAGGQRDMTALTVAYRDFANAPTNQSLDGVAGNNYCLFWQPFRIHKFTLRNERRF